jgi:antitoxin (DNA-binding transcriptional repressor) of toxin-antitoxin stability system
VVAATITSRDFNQDMSAARRAAATEPVIITDRGKPFYVLLSLQSCVINTVEELRTHGILIRSLREGIDYSTSVGRMVAGIFAVDRPAGCAQSAVGQGLLALIT